MIEKDRGIGGGQSMEISMNGLAVHWKWGKKHVLGLFVCGQWVEKHVLAAFVCGQWDEIYVLPAFVYEQ